VLTIYHQDDLYGLYLFLGVEPISQRFWWRKAILQPLEQCQPGALRVVRHYLQTVLMSLEQSSGILTRIGMLVY
jgi:hypothetical protein